MRGGMEWAAEEERRQLGNLIKNVISNEFSSERLGRWYQDLKLITSEIVNDGKFSRKGIRCLDRLESLQKILITEKRKNEIYERR